MTDTKDFSNTNRRGIAALEFVIVLPVILSLIWVMIWFGNAMIFKAELTVECREDAWEERYVSKQQRTWQSRPLLMLAASQSQFVQESESKDVSDLDFFDSWPEVGSSHVVLAGSWDHNELELANPPSWRLLPPNPKSPIFLAYLYGKTAPAILAVNRGQGGLADMQAVANATNNGSAMINNLMQGFNFDLKSLFDSISDPDQAFGKLLGIAGQYYEKLKSFL